MAMSTAMFLHAAYANDNDDAEIKQQIVRQSIAAHSGGCPCPYSKDRAGRNCGRRSAYSKPGGNSPLCYPEDVTAEMVRRYKERRR